MSGFDNEDIKRILSTSHVGLWRVEIQTGHVPAFFTDNIMDDLLGISAEVSPVERYVMHHNNIHPDDLQLFEDYAAKLAGDRTEVVYRYLHPVKGEMFVRCAGVRDTSADGVVYFGTHTDISDTIRLEKEKMAEQRLAEEVARKEASLVKSRKESQAKTEFLSRMSHDIRTPLNGIIGIMDINESHNDDLEFVAENRRKAKIAAQHLLALVNDVLDMGKLEDDHVETVNEPIDLKKICTEVLTICNIKANDNGISLIHDNGVNITKPNVLGSELYLNRVLMNILNNCVKYNKPHGEIRCFSRILFLDETSVVYEFNITDTGIGMSEDFLPHIFEPFTQERSDARSHYQGTGMGMAIVKKMVDRMNGTIEVESTKGVGSKFTIVIPFTLNETSVEADSDSEASNKSIAGMNLLLVEDNELNMEIAKFILEDSGATVTVAENGQIAYDMFVKRPAGSFDAVLMDIMMPVMDGYTATKMIRKSDKSDASTIPIIAMTANAFAEDIQKAKSAGMNEFLAKPLKLDVMIKTIGYYNK